MTKTDQVQQLIEAGGHEADPWNEPVQFAREIIGKGLIDGTVDTIQRMVQRVCGRIGPTKVVIISDVHIPFEHKKATENVLRFIDDVQPDAVNVNGDLLDCATISKYPKRPGTPSMVTEVEEGRAFFGRLREAAPKSQLDFGLGNHEQRMERFLMENSGLWGLDALSWRELLRLDHHEVELRDYMVSFDYGRLSVVHGCKVSKHAAYSAKAHLVDYGYENVVIGHTHRLGQYTITGHSGTRRAVEGGGLFDTEQALYFKAPHNWQNGFVVADIWPNGEPQLTMVEINPNGEFIAEGRYYG